MDIIQIQPGATPMNTPREPNVRTSAAQMLDLNRTRERYGSARPSPGAAVKQSVQPQATVVAEGTAQRK
jgi:hypothetical protein